MIDELPLVALLCAFADGESRICGAKELRVKESDRIKTVCAMITALGGRAEEHTEGLAVWGGLSGGEVFGAGDHRIVMSSAIAAAVCPVTITGAQAVGKSYPGFFEDLSLLGAEILKED